MSKVPDLVKNEVKFCNLVTHDTITRFETSMELIKNNARLTNFIHPSNSSKEEYQEIINKTGHKIPIYQEEDIIDLLDRFDVLVTYGHSSITLLGVLLRKPIVFLNLSEEDLRFSEFLDKNVNVECKNLSNISSDIKIAIIKKISDKDFEKYIEKYIGKFDGKSSERMANAILNIAKKKHVKI